MAYPFPIQALPDFPKIMAEVPRSMMKVADLQPTQYVVRIDRLQWLAAGNKPEGDDIPHVVTYRGVTYLYDGHHRWILASVSGVTHLQVRNVIIADSIEVEPLRCHDCGANFHRPDNCPNCGDLGRVCI